MIIFELWGSYSPPDSERVAIFIHKENAEKVLKRLEKKYTKIPELDPYSNEISYSFWIEENETHDNFIDKITHPDFMQYYPNEVPER